MKIYTDAHCHIMQKSADNRVIARISNATKFQDWQNLIKNSQQYGDAICLGIHPWYLNTAPNDWDTRLTEILRKNPKVMIGETGLDKFKPDLSQQTEFFIRHLEIAHEYARPLHLHCVGAWDKVLHIFKEYENKMPPVTVAHSFNGTPIQIKTLADKYNIYFSYSGRQLSTPTAKTILNLAATPSQRILVESDTDNDTIEYSLLDTAMRTIIEHTGVSADQINENFKKVIL